jgi:hypothetical protein
MVKATPDVERDTVFEGALGCHDRSPGCQPEGSDQLFRVGNFHLLFFAGRQGSSLELSSSEADWGRRKPESSATAE